MSSDIKQDLKMLYIPPENSHKGKNGRLLVIGGSHLFHAASLWALEVASRIVDLVHYSSVPENNALVNSIKSEFRNGIVIPREDIESYIEEDDCILIGPGMVRSAEAEINNSLRPPAGGSGQAKLSINNLTELKNIKDEGEQTEALTNYLLFKYPKKQWVIDAGALQMVDPNLIPKNTILTPHFREYLGIKEKVLNASVADENLDASSVAQNSNPSPQTLKASEAAQNFIRSAHSNDFADIKSLADKLNCIILLKGQSDIACSPTQFREIPGGNAGMTKGGTGDVLAGLIAALACKNDPFLATIAGSFINKAAGDELYKTVGPFFNATDLARKIPVVMNRLLIK
jgi:NAD(P)H-hydrate repair Nnr-like enzyme with NAD(P)H-hydrate dehydratase domain